jgi:acetyltransferase
VSELDINPLWADQSGVIALDARVRVKPAYGDASRRFAVRPYPSDLEGTLAARLTQIDYDREMAFVVFTSEAKEAVAVVGRLSESPGRERAEYAILVRSDQQGRGLGYAMMQHLIAFARHRGVGELYGHVLRENISMLDMCKELGFRRHTLEGEPSVLEVTLDLQAQSGK